MVYKTEERPNSYMERSSPGIFGTIQIHIGDSPRSIDPSEYEKGTRLRLQRVCCQMEECGINGSTTLTNREKNSMFVDTLPSPYYGMLIVNNFMEFGDLMYSVGRIEDGIKRGKDLFPMSVFKQCLERKEDHM